MNPVMKTSTKQLSGADWDAMEREVVEKIRLLKSFSQAMPGNPVMEKVANDLILPCVGLLADFCASVQIGEPGELGEGHPVDDIPEVWTCPQCGSTEWTYLPESSTRYCGECDFHANPGDEDYPRLP